MKKTLINTWHIVINGFLIYLSKIQPHIMTKSFVVVCIFKSINFSEGSLRNKPPYIVEHMHF